MPRTLPSGITALRGVSTTRAPIFLVEIRWLTVGTHYYSSAETVTYAGHVYEANRTMSIPTFEAGLIDRKNRDFSKLELKFDNLSDSGTSSFPFTALEASQNLEDALVFIHIWSPDAGDAIPSVWWGYTAGRKYDGSDKSITIAASFFFDALDAPLPTRLLSQSGFGTTDAAAATDDNFDELAVPVVYGVGSFKIRPTVYLKRSDGAYFNLNFVVSGCNGQPFSASDITAPLTKLFDNQPASAVEFQIGSAGQSAPANLTRFPDGGAHPNVAYGWAAFPITKEIKDRLDSITAEDIKMTVVNGRPLLDTALPSENPVLILKDILRDPNFGMGLPASVFDATALATAANYAGTRYQMRFELHDQKPATDIVQYILGNFHGFITFENGLIQIRCKQNNETSVATFSTIDSGGSGRKIHDDFTDVDTKDSSELNNQFTVKYRLKKRNRRIVTLYDPNAQIRAGGTYRKVVEDTLDLLEAGGVYDETQARILGAIGVREEQNGNLGLMFFAPFWDGIDIAIGDLITVQSPDIFGVNTVYRVTKQTIDTGGDYRIRFDCKVYKTAIYNDDSVALGTDLLRGGDATDAQGRPPDVTPVSLSIVAVGTGDTQGKQATLRATFTVPGFDPTAERLEGVFRESPIAQVEIWWCYQDENIEAARLGVSVPIIQQLTSFNMSADFQVDYHKSRTVMATFVAIGPNAARAPLGYIPDPTKVTTLTSNLSATGATANVVSSTLFGVSDIVQIEKEKLTILSKAAGTLTFINAAGIRTPIFNTLSIAHPTGTEISVDKLSYPFLLRSLTIPRFEYPIVTSAVVYQRPDGVKVKITDVSAENVEDYFVYWSILTDPGFGSATPSWYLSDPLVPAAGVNYINGKSLHMTIPQEAIAGPPGTVVFIRVAARNGKNNWSTQLSPIASAAVGDDGVPVVSTQPTIVVKSKGLRVKVVMPLLNMKTFPTNGKVEVVLRAVSAGSTTLGYLSDSSGSGWTSSASEFKFDLGLARTELFPLDKATVLGIWPTISTLAVYAYVTNAVGISAASPTRSFSVSAWEVLEITVDADVPSGLGTPDVQEYFGHFSIATAKPTTNVNTLDDYQVVMSTQGPNNPPAGDPTVGSAGVVKIHSGQAVGFKRKTSTPVTLYFYYRAHNQSGIAHAPASAGWSAWSSSGQILSTDISRPLQDVIGNSVPNLPERLELSSTSGSGHTSTTFILTGRTEADDFFNGMALHIPSFDSGTSSQKSSSYRQITDWVLSTQTLTISPAFDSTPSGATGFEIDRISVASDHAGKSGTGHTTTNFSLLSSDADISAVDDFYNGWSIYVPSQVAGDQIRRVIDYVGSTRTITFDTAVAMASINNVAYLLINGSFGWASSNETGIVAPVPFRFWLDGDTLQNVLETITPTADTSGYSLQQFEIQISKKAGVPLIRLDSVVKLASGGAFRFEAPSTYVPMGRIRWQNLYRESSDGWSVWSQWVRLPTNTAPPLYDPSSFPPLIIDHQGKNSWPNEYTSY